MLRNSSFNLLRLNRLSKNVFAISSVNYSDKKVTELMNNQIKQNESKNNEELIVPDREISLFGPRDIRLPLPGNVGVSPSDHKEARMKIKREQIKEKKTVKTIKKAKSEENIFTIELDTERHMRIFDQLIFASAMELKNVEINLGKLECRISECPKILCNDLQILFPSRVVSTQQRLTLFLFKQKVIDDDDIDNIGKEEFLEKCSQILDDISRRLIDCGYWAEFIDPLSSTLSSLATLSSLTSLIYSSAFTPTMYTGRFRNNSILMSTAMTATKYELENRYRLLSYSIENYGDCKFISHSQWGEKEYIATLITNAPIDSREIRDLIKLIST